MGDHDDQIDALSYALQPWQREMLKSVASESLRDQAEKMVADAKGSAPSTSAILAARARQRPSTPAAGSKPYGEVTHLFTSGRTRATPLMSLGTGKVLVLDGPDAGTVK